MVDIPTTSTNAEVKKALRRVKHKFQMLPRGLATASKDINSKIANELTREIESNYADFVSNLSHDHQDRSDTQIHQYRTNEGYRVVASGSQVLYDEFGTGDRGLMSPHPNKGAYALNAYNSGEHIKLDLNGSHYWVYYSTKDGKFTSSYGVPAGMFMYKSFENISNGIAANIAFNEYLKECKKYGKGK